MKAVTVSLACIAALAAAAPASAKELVRATVCGASGCETFTDRATLREIPGGESTVALGRPVPYYRVTVVNAEPDGTAHAFSMYYVPSADAMAWDEEGLVRYHPIYGPKANGVMRRLVSSIEPFAPPRVSSVAIGDRVLRGAAAQTYLALFSAGERPDAFAAPTDWVDVDLESSRGSPWTDGSPDLVYSASSDLVERGGLQYELAEAIAADVEAARALDARPAPRARQWALGIAGAGALAVLGVLGVRTGRRRAGASIRLSS